jgi:hypothetical protein
LKSVAKNAPGNIVFKEGREMSHKKMCYWAVWASLFLIVTNACALSDVLEENPNQGADANSKLGDDQVVEFLLEMQYAYASQRSMLKTMQLKARMMTPQNGQTHDSRACLTMDIGAFPAAKVLCHLAYTGNSQGHSLQNIQTFNLNRQGNLCLPVPHGISAHSLMFSYDGLEARILSNGQGFIYTHMEQVPNVGLYDPRGGMPHLFNPTVMQMLDNPEEVHVSPGAHGLFLLTYQDQHRLHQFFVAPQLDFMIVKLERISVMDHFPVTEWEQGIRYRRTPAGFWYPARSYTKSHGRVIQLTRIDSFTLNPQAVAHVIDFTAETPVYQHQKQSTDPSYYCLGQAHAAHEPDMAPVSRVIAGHILDAGGSPVPGALVQVCGDSHLDDYESMLWHYPRNDEHLVTCTDDQGFFTLTLDVSKDYHVLIYEAGYAPMLVRNVPIGTQDLSVRLSLGGVISGKVVYLQDDARIPVPNVEIKAAQIDPRPLPLMRLDCDRIVRTDAQGNFQFDRLLVRVIDYQTGCKGHWDAQSHMWEIACLDNLTAVTLGSQNSSAELQLVVKPQAKWILTHNIMP